MVRASVVVAGVVALVLALLTVTVGPVGAAATGSISGTVSDDDGVPLVGAHVEVRSQSGGGPVVREVSTGTGGAYVVEGLDAGGYGVRFTGPGAGPRYLPGYRNAFVSETTPTTGVDVRLTLESAIGGTVVDSDRASLEGVTVTAYEPSGGGWTAHESTQTDGTGAYQLVVDPGTYRLGFGKHQYAPAFFPQGALPDEGDDVVLGEGDHLSGLDSTLVPGGHVSGTVTGQLHRRWHPAEAPVAVLFRRSGSTFRQLATQEVGAEGRYDVDDLPAGTYRMQFSARRETNHAGEFWRHAPDLEHAQDITVDVGRTVSGIDTELRALGRVSGRVTDTEGHPLEGVGVEVKSYLGDVVRGRMLAKTQADGRYKVVGLTGGLYRVTVAQNPSAPSGDRYRTQYWPFAESARHAVDIAVGPVQKIEHVDAVLEPSGLERSRARAGQNPLGRPGVHRDGATHGALSGGLSNVLGEPAYGPKLVAFRREQGRWTQVAVCRSYRSLAYGPHYVFTDLEPGTYRVQVIDDQLGIWAPEFVGGSRGIGGATDVVVTAGVDSADNDITLDPVVRFARGYRIRGRARVGSTLRLAGGLLSPTDATLKVRWLADGHPIQGADGRAFTVRDGQRGRRISAELAGHRPALITTSTSTRPTTRVTARPGRS